jgi:hypothetical protein
MQRKKEGRKMGYGKMIEDGKIGGLTPVPGGA